MNAKHKILSRLAVVLILSVITSAASQAQTDGDLIKVVEAIDSAVMANVEDAGFPKQDYDAIPIIMDGNIITLKEITKYKLSEISEIKYVPFVKNGHWDAEESKSLALLGSRVDVFGVIMIKTGKTRIDK
jgi:hypothetical protein